MSGAWKGRLGVVAAVVLVVLGMSPMPVMAAVPVITTFTPTTAAIGDSVTITVSNTDPDPANNTVLINGSAATVTARTSTTLTFTVNYGNAGGLVTVTTPGGTATSTADLTVLPYYLTTADVSSTGRITVGTKTTLSVPAGKTAIRLFDGATTDRFAVLTGNGSPSVCNFDLRAYTTSMVQSGASACLTGSGWIDTMAATGVAGTRTLTVKNTSTTAGTVDVTVLNIAADPSLGTALLDGSSKTITLGTAGQNGYLTFSGTAAQRISLQVTSAASAFLCCYLKWGIYDPTGALVGTTKNGVDFLDPVTLPSTGTYQIIFDPAYNRTGTVTLAAASVSTDANLGTLPLTGAATTGSISAAGQNGYFTFSGAANQRIAVQTTSASSSLLCCYVKWGIYDATGTQVGSSKSGLDFMEPVTLPSAATYQLRIDPAASRVGSITVKAWDASTDVNAGVLALDGTTKTVTVSNPGQKGYVTFTGTANQKVAFKTTGASAALLPSNVSWALYDPNGSQVGATKRGNDSLDAVTLPTAGTYTLRVDPAGANVGSLTVAAWDTTTDANLGVLSTNGTSVTVSLSNPGQNGYLTFTGTASQRLAVQTANAGSNFLPNYVSWGVYDAAGTQYGATKTGNDFLDVVTLGAAGTYKVYIDPLGTRTGSISVTAYTVPADASLGTLALTGTATVATISNPGQNNYFTFPGTANQRVAVQTTAASSSFGTSYVTTGIYDPSGSLAGSNVLANGFIDTVTLSTTGTYKVIVNPGGSRVGSITVTAWTVPADANLGTLPTTGTPTTASITNPGQNGYFTFSGTAGQTVVVTAKSPSTTMGCCYTTWTVKGPDGGSLGSKKGVDKLKLVLSTTGTYTVYIDPLGSRTGTMVFAANV
ncbi:IPT/TIG domain-containing protein [Actinoplanes sp. NPDC051851]|uniref:beta strand repeat-containing protein n=1 Tax=Actinoplanes sp. NPDC051851 TaxID=3154753 RepID=UPI0034322DE0